MSNTAEYFKVTKGLFWANANNGLLRVQPFPYYNHLYNNLDCDIVGRDEAYANATLYAEAHNIYNKNGIRPADFISTISSKDKRIAKLEESLNDCKLFIEALSNQSKPNSNLLDFLDKINTALSNKTE